MHQRKPALAIGRKLLGLSAAAGALTLGLMAVAQDQAPAPSQQVPAAATAAPPLRLEPAQLAPSRAPARFDASLDALVRDGVVTPAERGRIRDASGMRPIDVPAHQQACRSGALSEQECRTGVVVRWRGRSDAPVGQDPLANGADPAAAAAAAGLRLGADGRPLPPLTVPVSALLAGGGGSFRLEDVFGVTPRPAPIVGNGNRRLLFPVIGSAINSSNFGFRLHPVLGIWRLHAGQDLAAPEGTPVVASLSGRVLSSGLAGGYGLAIEIEHSNPRRRTLYGHLSELYVKAGDRVRQGEVIGRVGSTGLSTGPHLHFELRLPQAGGWVAVDPGDLDPGAGAAGTDAIALLIGQLLGSLERPAPAAARESS